MEGGAEATASSSQAKRREYLDARVAASGLESTTADVNCRSFVWAFGCFPDRAVLAMALTGRKLSLRCF